MAEEGSGWEDPLNYTEDVATIRGGLRELEPIEERYSRGQLNDEVRSQILFELGGFDPALRANLYAMYAQMALTDPTVMTDAEVFVLSFAYQDHKATQAVEAGAVEAVEQGAVDELGVPYDAAWYADAVSHHGNEAEAKEYLIRVFDVDRAPSEYSQLPDATIGEQIGKWLSIDPTGGETMQRQPTGPTWEAIQAGLNWQRDEWGDKETRGEDSGFATKGDQLWNDFWNTVDVISIIAGTAGAVAYMSPRNPVGNRPMTLFETGKYVGPVRHTRNLGNAIARAWRERLMGGQQQLNFKGEADMWGTQNLTNTAYVAARTQRSGQQVLGHSATASQRLSRMAGNRMLSAPGALTFAGTVVFGNAALDALVIGADPQGIRDAEDAVRQEEINNQFDEVYSSSIAAGLSHEQAERRARLDVPEGQPPDERSEETPAASVRDNIEIIGGASGVGGFSGAPIAVRRDVLNNVMSLTNQVNQTATVRLNSLMQIEGLRSEEWQEVYDNVIANNGSASAAEAEANAAYPPMEEEQVNDVLAGELDYGEALDPERAGAITQVFNELGLRWFDPTSETMQDVMDQGYHVFKDSSDPEGLRYIVAPDILEPPELALVNEATGGKAEADEDPWIRVPDDYLAQTYQPVQNRRVWNPAARGEQTELADKRGINASAPIGWEDAPAMSERRAAQLAADRGAVYGSVSADDEGWEKRNKMRTLGLPELYEPGEQVGPQYRESAVLDFIADLSPVQTFRFQNLAARAGFYQNDRPLFPGRISTDDQDIVYLLMGQANVDGDDVWEVLTDVAENGPKEVYQPKPPKTTTKVARAPFSVPAHLRKIPGEKTIAEETKARFRQQTGRDPRPDELDQIAKELTGYYTSSNQEEIALYLAAYNGDNQGLLTGAQMERIENPGAAADYDIAERWANEIDLNARREENSETFQRMLSATLGNRPSIGNMTAAKNVTQIGRT